MNAYSFFFQIRLRRIGALALCFLFALSLFLSAAFLLAEHEHDCEGEHCRICAVIRQTVVFLRAERGAVVSPLLMALAASCVTGSLQNSRGIFVVVFSPVSFKVKLSD